LLLPLLLGYNILPLPHPYFDPLLPSYLDTISSHSLILTWIRYCPSYLDTISSHSLILTWIPYSPLTWIQYPPTPSSSLGSATAPLTWKQYPPSPLSLLGSATAPWHPHRITLDTISNHSLSLLEENTVTFPFLTVFVYIYSIKVCTATPSLYLDTIFRNSLFLLGCNISLLPRLT
jgi:hypothetical protein